MNIDINKLKFRTVLISDVRSKPEIWVLHWLNIETFVTSHCFILIFFIVFVSFESWNSCFDFTFRAFFLIRFFFTVFLFIIPTCFIFLLFLFFNFNFFFKCCFSSFYLFFRFFNWFFFFFNNFFFLNYFFFNFNFGFAGVSGIFFFTFFIIFCNFFCNFFCFGFILINLIFLFCNLFLQNFNFFLNFIQNLDVFLCFFDFSFWTFLERFVGHSFHGTGLFLNFCNSVLFDKFVNFFYRWFTFQYFKFISKIGVSRNPKWIKMTVNFRTTVGPTGWTEHFYFFSGMHIDSSHVPTFDYLIVTHLENNWSTSFFRILNKFTCVHICFVINNSFIIRFTMATIMSRKSLF